MGQGDKFLTKKSSTIKAEPLNYPREDTKITFQIWGG
tara:strand:- start:563 stop:673 length:111 start_codon:yes stop_codon:yes gene_type:complete